MTFQVYGCGLDDSSGSGVTVQTLRAAADHAGTDEIVQFFPGRRSEQAAGQIVTVNGIKWIIVIERESVIRPCCID